MTSRVEHMVNRRWFLTGAAAGNWHYILAASTVAALPMLVIFVFVQRQIVESITSAGFK